MSLGIASIWRIALQKAIITHNIHVSSYFSMRCHVLHRVSQEEKAFSGLTLAYSKIGTQVRTPDASRRSSMPPGSGATSQAIHLIVPNGLKRPAPRRRSNRTFTRSRPPATAFRKSRALSIPSRTCDSVSGSEAFAYRCLSIAQRYAEVRKGMGLKIVGYAADSILQMLVAKINQEAEAKVL